MARPPARRTSGRRRKRRSRAPGFAPVFLAVPDFRGQTGWRPWPIGSRHSRSEPCWVCAIVVAISVPLLQEGGRKANRQATALPVNDGGNESCVDEEKFDESKYPKTRGYVTC